MKNPFWCLTLYINKEDAYFTQFCSVESIQKISKIEVGGGYGMNATDFVKGMNSSIHSMEETFQQMKKGSALTKTEQLQMMQALLELSQRIKLLEMHIEIQKNEGDH